MTLMVTLVALVVAQDASLAHRLADMIQYLVGTGIIAIVALNIRTAMLVHGINTVLREPEMGLIAKVKRHGGSIEALRTEVERLKNGDRDDG